MYEQMTLRYISMRLHETSWFLTLILDLERLAAWIVDRVQQNSTAMITFQTTDCRDI